MFWLPGPLASRPTLAHNPVMEDPKESPPKYITEFPPYPYDHWFRRRFIEGTADASQNKDWPSWETSDLTVLSVNQIDSSTNACGIILKGTVCNGMKMEGNILITGFWDEGNGECPIELVQE